MVVGLKKSISKTAIKDKVHIWKDSLHNQFLILLHHKLQCKISVQVSRENLSSFGRDNSIMFFVKHRRRSSHVYQA